MSKTEGVFRVYALVAILTIGAAVRVTGVEFGLPNTEARPDELIIVSVAMHMAKNHLHPHFFEYPTLFPTILLALYGVYFVVGYALGWFGSLGEFKAIYYTDPSSFYLIARMVGVTSGTLTLYLTYLLGRRLYGVSVGLLSALFLALCPVHVRDSHFGKVDVLMTCLIVLVILLSLDLYRRGRLKDYFLSGAISGLATSTKYPAGVVCFSILIAHLLRSCGSGLKRLERLLHPYLWAAASAMTAAFFIASPYILIDWKGFWMGLPRISENVLGNQVYSLGSYGAGWFHHATFSFRYGLGLAMEILAVAGVIWAAYRRRAEDLIALSFLIYLLFIGNRRWIFVRYIIPVVPVMMVFAAALLLRMGGMLKGRRQRVLAACVAAPLLLAEPVYSIVQFDRLLLREDTRLQAAAWIRAHIPDGSTIALHGGYFGEPQLPESEGMLRERLRDQADFNRDAYLLSRSFRPRYNLIRFGSSYSGWIEKDYDLATLKARGIDYVVTQESPLRTFGAVDERMGEILGRHATPLAVFDPFAPGASPRPVYDPIDAFFVPLAGFAGVERPGPKITVYRLDPVKE